MDVFCFSLSNPAPRPTEHGDFKLGYTVPTDYFANINVLFYPLHALSLPTDSHLANRRREAAITASIGFYVIVSVCGIVGFEVSLSSNKSEQNMEENYKDYFLY